MTATHITRIPQSLPAFRYTGDNLALSEWINDLGDGSKYRINPDGFYVYNGSFFQHVNQGEYVVPLQKIGDGLFTTVSASQVHDNYTVENT